MDRAQRGRAVYALQRWRWSHTYGGGTNATGLTPAH